MNHHSVMRLPLLLFAIAMAAQSAEFKFPGQTITVPDGYEVELVAGPPLVDRPISIAFDEQGRLYATDSAGMSDKADKQAELKPHRVVRLEDTNGDGRFDKSVVFADRLGFPEGCMWLDGSLYVGAPPNISKFTDTDGDGVADQRTEWFQGKTVTGCGNDVHGPYAGRDGWIYWTKGAFAEQHYTLPNGKQLVTRVSHIFRARPDCTGIEPVMTGGMDNPVGVAFLSTGERILSCTFFQNPAGGRRDGLIHAIYGGVYGKDKDGVSDHKMTGDLMPVLLHMGAAAPCGITAASAQLFGGGHADNIFTCYFNLHKVSRHVLAPDGATFKTQDSDFVTSTGNDFHPTDVLEDADGSLLIADTGGWYKVCCPTSQLAKPDVLGAIYRVRKKSAPRIDDPRGLKLAWNSMEPAGLAKLLGDERVYVRERAIRELGKKGAPAIGALVNVLKTSASADARRNAVWALSRITGGAARNDVRLALDDRDASVRHAAIHIAGVWRDAAARGRLQKFLGGADDQDARAAAEALGRFGDKRAVPVLLEAAGRVRGGESVSAPMSDASRVLEHSLIYALIEIGDRDGTAAGLKSANIHTRRAALVALDRMDDGNLQPQAVTSLLASTEPLLRQTASWIVSHRPEWGGDVAGFLRERLATKSLADAERVELEAQLASLAKSPTIAELLVATLRDGSFEKSARLSALRAMAAASLKETPAAWLDEVSKSLGSGDADMVKQAVATARSLTLPKGGHAPMMAALQNVGRKASVPDEVRLDALAFAASLPVVESALFDWLRASLDTAKPLGIRSAAATTLAKAKLTPEQQLALVESVKTINPMEMPKILPAFERGANEALGLKLVAALKDSTGFKALRVDLVKPLLAKYTPVVRQQGEALILAINEDVAKQAAHLDEVAKKLPPGDERRGQAVFTNTKAGCTTCHAIGYLGGHIGPDLTRIGQVRNERDLLESVVYPSASFVRSYEPFIVSTKSGDDYSGIIKKDAPDEVVLITGPQQEQHIPRNDLADMRPGTVSIMPQGLEQTLTLQDLADLITFLRNRK